MGKKAHTPTPWIVGAFDMIWPESDIEFSDGKWREKVPEPRIIASASKGNLSPNEDRANAAFIVRAVNAHDDLVDALTAIRDLSGLDHSISGASATVMSRMADIHQHADAALSRHGEGK